MTAYRVKELHQMRVDKGISQQQAAEELGISQSMYSQIELGNRGCSDATKVKIVNYFGKPIEYLFFGSKSTNSSN